MFSEGDEADVGAGLGADEAATGGVGVLCAGVDTTAGGTAETRLSCCTGVLNVGDATGIGFALRTFRMRLIKSFCETPFSSFSSSFPFCITTSVGASDAGQKTER